MRSWSETTGPLRRIARRLLLFVILLILLAVFLLERFGFPDWVARYALTWVNRGNYVVEARSVRASPLEGIVLDHARLFRKSVVGPPAFEAEQAVVWVDFIAWFLGKPSLRKMSARNGIIRPETLVSDQRRVASDFGEGKEFLLELEDIDCQGVTIRDARAVVELQGRRVEVNEFGLQLSRERTQGSIRGNLVFDTGSSLLEGHLDGRCSPRVLLPMMEAHGLTVAAGLTRRFTFYAAPPCWEVDFSSVRLPQERLSASGSVWAQECAYRGVDLLRLDTGFGIEISPTNVMVNVRPLMAVRSEGLARGSLGVDSRAGRREVTFDAVSSLDPRAMSQMTGVLTNLFGNVLSFKPPFNVSTKGRVDLLDLNRLDVRSSWECGGLAAHVFSAENCSFVVESTGRTNRIEKGRAVFFDGALSGAAEFVVPEEPGEPVRYAVKGRLERADFEGFVNSLRREEQKDYEGTLSLRWDLTGRTGPAWAEALAGTGSVAVEDGRVFMLPVFGGLSAHLTRAIPGLDFVLRQSEATADFDVRNAKLHTGRVRIEGGVLSLQGEGDASFDRTLDFNVQLTLFKSHTFMGKFIRIPTYLLSKLFEFRLKGTLDNPSWYPVNFSEELLEHFGFKEEGRRPGSDPPRPAENAAPGGPSPRLKDPGGAGPP